MAGEKHMKNTSQVHVELLMNPRPSLLLMQAVFQEKALFKSALFGCWAHSALPVGAEKGADRRWDMCIDYSFQPAG